MDSAQAATQASTWVDFAFHVFDKVWYVVGGAIPGFISGWLLMHKPKFMTKKDGDK